MKRIIVVILLSISQTVIFAEDIYENAINHFIEDIVKKQDFSGGTRDSIFFETNEIFPVYGIPTTICGYKIVKMRMDDFKNYLDTCSRGGDVIFSIERMGFCKTCDAKFSVLFVACYSDTKLNVDLHLHEVRYDYNSKTNTFVYRHCASGMPSYSFEKAYLERKGWRNK